MLVIPYRNPVLVAKMLATIDVLSGGRVILTAGVGNCDITATKAVDANYLEAGTNTVVTADKRELAIGRGRRIRKNTLYRQLMYRSVQRDNRKLRRRVVLEDALVAGRLQQVFIGVHRRHLAQILLDVGSGGYLTRGRRSPAFRRHDRAQQPR